MGVEEGERRGEDFGGLERSWFAYFFHRQIATLDYLKIPRLALVNRAFHLHLLLLDLIVAVDRPPHQNLDAVDLILSEFDRLAHNLQFLLEVFVEGLLGG